MSRLITDKVCSASRLAAAYDFLTFACTPVYLVVRLSEYYVVPPVSISARTFDWGFVRVLGQVVTVYRVRKLFHTVCPLVHCCTELRVPAIYMLPIESGLSVWWNVEYAT